MLEAGEAATNLPAGCCDAIFMRRVYHHLSKPSAILASIHEALKPDGRLVIIEFRRNGLVGRFTGMGIDRAPLIEAVTAGGFEVIASEEWPGWDHYVAVFKKSAAARPRTSQTGAAPRLALRRPEPLSTCIRPTARHQLQPPTHQTPGRGGSTAYLVARLPPGAALRCDLVRRRDSSVRGSSLTCSGAVRNVVT